MKTAQLLPFVVLAISCGGGAAAAPPAGSPADKEPAAVVAPAEPPAAKESAPAPKSTPAAAAEPPAPTHVEFPPHASVEAAIKAVPQGAARLNMSQDLLDAPLLDMKRYEKCKVPHSTKVLISVAVYDGAAVGVDITTKPKSPKLDECLDGVVRGMKWDKVQSLNTTNVNF